MDTIDRDVLAMLARGSGYPSVSLYLPTHRVVVEKDQDRLRLKNLLKSAAERLLQDGKRAVDVESILAPARSLLEDDTFWLEMTEGLAVFLTRDGMRVYRVGTTMPEQFVVGDRLYLRPLALASNGHERFYALAFDRNRARLYLGDRTSITEVPIKDAPTSLAEETKYDQREESLQFTSFASQGKAIDGGRVAMYHGHGGQNEDKDRLGRYANDLERAVTRQIGADSKIPLILFGVENQLLAYRAVNTYPALFSEHVTGASDELTDKQIKTKALEMLSLQKSAEVQADLYELREKPATVISDDPVEIASAAATGRVKTLFVDDSTGPYGLLDRQMNVVREFCSATPRYLRETADADTPAQECGWDLGDLALAETVLHGGSVHAFSGEDSPVKGVAAVFRY
ncbi:MAG: hypothetical protein AB2L09_00175 [Coriobacteriia bacterium]